MALFAGVGDGSLDHVMVKDRSTLGVDGEAHRRPEVVRAHRGEPDWFSLGLMESGELAGYVVPELAADAAMIAKIGVAGAPRDRR